MNDLLQVYKKTLTNTHQSLRKVPLLLAIPFILALTFSFVSSLSFRMLNFTMATGFLLAIVYAFLLSLAMEAYYEGIEYNRLSKSLFETGKRFFIPIYSIYFLLMLVKFLSQTLTLQVPVLLVLYVFMNPLPETLYLKGKQGMEAVRYSMEFQRENFFHWILPLALYLLIHSLLFSMPQLISSILAADIINQMGGLSGDMVFVPIDSFAKNVFSSLITGYYMIFRGHLFTILSTSSRRKRQYMGGFYG